MCTMDSGFAMMTVDHCDIERDVVILETIAEMARGEVSLVTFKGETTCMKTATGDDVGQTDLEEYWREARVLWELEGAGGAPRLMALGTDWPLVIMEYCQGVTLRSFIDTHGTQDRSLVYDILQKVAVSLDELHSKGFSHNDIGADNVLVCRSNGDFVTRIIDFGYSSKLSEADGSEAFNMFWEDQESEEKVWCSRPGFQDVCFVFAMVQELTGDLSLDQVTSMTVQAFSTSSGDESPMVRVAAMLEVLASG